MSEINPKIIVEEDNDGYDILIRNDLMEKIKKSAIDENKTPDQYVIDGIIQLIEKKRMCKADE